MYNKSIKTGSNLTSISTECHRAGLIVGRQINSQNVHVFNSCIQVKLGKEEIKKPSRLETENHLLLLCVS